MKVKKFNEIDKAGEIKQMLNKYSGFERFYYVSSQLGMVRIKFVREILKNILLLNLKENEKIKLLQIMLKLDNTVETYVFKN